jgi:hypothetical protein
MTYSVGNPGCGSQQAQKCGTVKLVKYIYIYIYSMMYPLYMLINVFSTQNWFMTTEGIRRHIHLPTYLDRA